MKIFIRDIPGAGLSIEKTVTREEIGLDEDIFKCLTPLRISAQIDKAGDAVLVKAEIKARYEFTCARCLEPVQQDRTDTFDLYFEIIPEVEFILLWEELRQELLLALTPIVLCREDCRGLCPDCGLNLNAQQCRCEVKGK